MMCDEVERVMVCKYVHPPYDVVMFEEHARVLVVYRDVRHVQPRHLWSPHTSHLSPSQKSGCAAGSGSGCVVSTYKFDWEVSEMCGRSCPRCLHLNQHVCQYQRNINAMTIKSTNVLLRRCMQTSGACLTCLTSSSARTRTHRRGTNVLCDVRCTTGVVSALARLLCRQLVCNLAVCIGAVLC